METCSPAALVGLDIELPVGAGLANDGAPPRVGCSRLVCEACGAYVRHADGRVAPDKLPPSRHVAEALHASTDPASSPHLDGSAVNQRSRAYFCRCGWASVHLGGWRSLGQVDAPWKCAGHEARFVEAPEPPAAAPTKPVAPSGPKIRLDYALGVHPEFATASELRDALLGSYPDAAYFEAPVVPLHRDDVAPAWGWVVELLRRRSDWWAAIGVALQHAVVDGGDLARTAFADLLADYRDSFVLLPWAAPLAATLPNVRARGSGTGWGHPDLRLETIVRDQTAFASLMSERGEAALLGHGKGGKIVVGPLSNGAELRTLLEETARAGQFPDGRDGPWSWLGFELRTRGEWLRDELVRHVDALDGSDEPQLFAWLDWVSEEQDLWRFVPTLERWREAPPAWSKTPAKAKPRGWRRTIRSAYWPGVETLGDVARAALGRSRAQLATPPILDLPALYAPTSASER